MPFLTLGADMARPSRTGGETKAATQRKAKPVKGRDPKTRPQKALKTDRNKKASRTKPSITDLQEQLGRQARELEEARQQQAASSEVLLIISSSAGALKPVFQAITKSAVHLCKARFGAVFGMEGELLHLVTDYNFGATQRQLLGALYPMKPSRGHISGRAILAGSTVQIPDINADEDYKSGEAKKAGFRSLLAAPLLRGGRAIGSIVIYRTEPGTFTARQSALLQNFAAQAVIAIENARLFNETKEALERQTATADILKVIASSPSDVLPVFEAIVGSAKRLLGGFSAAVFRFIDGIAHLQAITPTNPAADAIMQNSFPRPVADFQSFAMAHAGRIVQTPDTEALSDDIRDIARARGFRSMLITPLLREGTPIGLISVTRVEPGPFSVHFVQLLQTFADQAVIAIENVRLFNETQEALERQTATADILRVISNSPGDVQPVFDTVAEHAARICGAQFVDIMVVQDNAIRQGASFGNLAGLNTGETVPLNRSTVMGRSICDREPVHIADALAAGDEFPDGRQLALRFGHRTTLAVPLLREDRSLGTILVRRTEVRPFEDKHVALLKTFADQAAIAIENARLFNETQEALERQTATADILKVIASSPDDVQPVFEAIAERSNRIVDGRSTAVYSLVDGVAHLMAFTPTSPEADAALRALFPRPLLETVFGEVISRGELFQIGDIQDKSFLQVARNLAQLRGYRSLLFVPLLRDKQPIGAISVTRSAPGKFADHHIQLLRTFADQAVIAISNVRLFQEVRQRTRDLSQSLDDLRTAQDRLIQTEKLASLGQLTAGIAHEIKNPLNFVNNFSALSAELTDELNDAAQAGRARWQGPRRSRRIDRHAEGQSPKGRPARQARRLHRQEHAAAFA